MGVHSCQVLRSQLYTAPELLESAAGAGFKPAMTWRLLSAVLGQLTGLAPGQYLLTHQPGADAMCLFTATSAAEQESEVSLAPYQPSVLAVVPAVCHSPLLLKMGNCFRKGTNSGKNCMRVPYLCWHSD